MPRFPISTAVALIAIASFIAGCGGGNDADTNTTPVVETDDHGHEHESGHDHPDHGPHGGDLVELGGDDYHAEVVHGDDGSVTVYILDGAAASTVAIDATELNINVTHDGQPEQFTLAASPEAVDAEGMSSRFVSNDAELGEHLDEEGASAKLVVRIDGTPYSGNIAHSHDHEHGGHGP
jgi:hypothetical protein